MPRRYKKYSVYYGLDKPEKYTIKNPIAKTGTISSAKERKRVRKAAAKFLSCQNSSSASQKTFCTNLTANFSSETAVTPSHAEKPSHTMTSTADSNLTEIYSTEAIEESIEFDEVLSFAQELTHEQFSNFMDFLYSQL